MDAYHSEELNAHADALHGAEADGLVAIVEYWPGEGFRGFGWPSARLDELQAPQWRTVRADGSGSPWFTGLQG